MLFVLCCARAFVCFLNVCVACVQCVVRLFLPYKCVFCSCLIVRCCMVCDVLCAGVRGCLCVCIWLMCVLRL